MMIKFKVSYQNTYILVAIVVALLNVIFNYNFTASIIYVSIEVIFLLYLLIIKYDLISFLCYYLIFLSPCIEFGFLQVDNTGFYGFKNFRIFGLNIALLIIILAMIFIILKSFKIRISIFTKRNNITRFFSIMLLLNILATVVGIFNILINDNNIKSFNNFFYLFFTECYIDYWTICIIFIFIIALNQNKRTSILNIEKSLIASSIALSIQIIFSFVFKFYGGYGVLTTMLCSAAIIYVPLFLLLGTYRKVMYNGIYSFLLSVAVIISILYNASGKYLLVILYCLIILFIILYRKFKGKFILAIIIALFTFPLVFLVIESLRKTNVMFSIKYNDVIKLLSFWEPDWFQIMPRSPQIRIGEIINTAVEFMNKPQYIIWGKGFLGTTHDHIGIYGIYDPTGFSIDQYTNNTFYYFHDYIIKVLMRSGLFGVSIMVYYLIKIYRNMHKNLWLIIGGLWYILFNGFSFSISVIGIYAFVIGLYYLDNQNFQTSLDTNTKKTTGKMR